MTNDAAADLPADGTASPTATEETPQAPEESAQLTQQPTPLNPAESRQLRRLRRWGTTGALLMACGSTSSYGAADPIPNPVDGLRVIGLLSQIGPAALALSYTGIGLVVLCWFLLGRFAIPGRARRLSRSQLRRTLVMWAVPFVITPPLFSRDVYSYLAVGAMMTHGDNPYHSGPYDALGDTNPLAHQVDPRWQHTATPYGPAFLLIMRGVVAITGEHVLRGVLLQRLVELLGVALIVWAVPRLAHRCGMDPVAALWLGVLNPLVLFHLIGGGHNEALMLGLMLSGLVIALDRSVVFGTTLIVLGVGIKITAVLALAFLVIMLARRSGTRWRPLLVNGAIVTGISVVVYALLSWAAGVGIGLFAALGTPSTVRSFLSVTTSLAVGAGDSGLLLGLGDHTAAAVQVLQPVGTAVAAVLAMVVMWRSWRGRVEPIFGLGLAMGAFVLLSPVIQPWYLLWAAIPLAAAAPSRRYRRMTVWLTMGYSVIMIPNGATIPAFTIVQAVAVAAIVVGIVFGGLFRRGLPVSDPARALPIG